MAVDIFEQNSRRTGLQGSASYASQRLLAAPCCMGLDRSALGYSWSKVRTNSSLRVIDPYHIDDIPVSSMLKKLGVAKDCCRRDGLSVFGRLGKLRPSLANPILTLGFISHTANLIGGSSPCSVHSCIWRGPMIVQGRHPSHLEAIALPTRLNRTIGFH